MRSQANNSFRIDYYGVLKLLMAIMIAMGHYNLLVGEIKYGSYRSIVLNRIISLFIFLSLNTWSSLPIVFFVLSGVSIYKGYYNKLTCFEYEKEIGVKTFLMRRIRRLYPIMWVSIGIWVIADCVYLYHFGSWWTDRGSGLSNIILAITGFSVGTVFNEFDKVNGPIWYISVLMVCYVLFFYICRIKQKRILKLQPALEDWIILAIPILAGFSIKSYNISLPFLNSTVARGYIGFFWGIILAKYLDNREKNTAVIVCSILILVVMSFLLLLFSEYSNLFFDDWDFILCFVIAPAIIVLFERYKNSIILNNGISDFMGKVSFPFYLLHMPVYLSVEISKEVYDIDCDLRVWNELLFTLIISILICMVQRIKALRRNR